MSDLVGHWRQRLRVMLVVLVGGCGSLTAANHAPTLIITASPSTTVFEDAGALGIVAGTKVSDVVVKGSGIANVTDVDISDGVSVAIIGKTGASTWKYTINGGTTWSALNPSAALALLLAADAQTRVYYQPALNESGNGITQLTFRAWDQTSGSNGGTADLTVNEDCSQVTLTVWATTTLE